MGRLAVKPVKPDPQSVGSCITYLRRYSLQSMVGIAPEDDDGNAASGQVKPPANKADTKPPVTAEAQIPPASPYDPPPPPWPEKPKLATPEQVQKIQIILKEAGITDRAKAMENFTSFAERPIHSSKELTISEASDWISANSEQKQEA
jgi:hypothetical protein